MKDSLQLVKGLLSGRSWDAVILATDHLLADSELTTEQKAFCYYAKCRALSNLDRYSAALEPGQRSVYLATDGGNRDFLGRCLLEVAYVQERMQMYPEATATYELWLAETDRFSDELRRMHVDVLTNLAITRRALGDTSAALDYFLQAWKVGMASSTSLPAEELWKVEEARSSAVWEALTLRNFEVANELLAHAEEYHVKSPSDVRAKARHLVDLARATFLQGDLASATGYAVKAVSLSEKYSDVLANAFLVLYDIDTTSGDVDLAVSSGTAALHAADLAEQHELVGMIRDRLIQLRIKCSDQVVEAISDTLVSRNLGHSRRSHL